MGVHRSWRFGGVTIILALAVVHVIAQPPRPDPGRFPLPSPSPSPAPPPGPAPDPDPVPEPSPDPAPPLDPSAALFDPAVVHELRLWVHSADWERLKTEYKENTYYPADLHWNGQVVHNLGIRSRGGGSRSAVKPGLRVDFDRYDTDQEFLGLKSLVLDNLLQDASMLKERAIMLLFNEMGLPAPRVVHARLFVNNDEIGLYTIVEPVDKRFLKKRFAENDGYLFEFQHQEGYGFQYLGSDPARYALIFSPKTHELEPADTLYGPIEAMVRAIEYSSDSTWVSDLGAYLDPVLFLKHLAVETFVAEHDGILGYAGMNNFYLYRLENTSRAQLIPWDKDFTFYTIDFDIYRNMDLNELTGRAMLEPALKAAYHDALRACAGIASRPVPVAPPPVPGLDPPPPTRGWLEDQVVRMADQIRPYALADVRKPFDNERFEDDIQKSLAFARQRAANVLDQIK